MSFNIFDAVKGQITPDLINKASSFLGESESSIGKAFSGILPSLLGGIISKSSSGNAGANEVFRLAKESHNTGFEGILGNVFNDGGAFLNKGANFLKHIFGDKAESIIESISNFAGIKRSSSSSLMSLAAPMVLNTIGKHTNDTGLTVGGLTSLLSSQKNNLINLLPTGLSSIAGIVGLDNVSTSLSNETRKNLSAVRNYNEENESRSSSPLKWLLPLLLIALAALAIWYFAKGCNNGDTSSNATIGDTTLVVNPGTTDVQNGNTTVNLPSLSIDTVSGLVNYDLGKDTEFSLPDGIKFTAPEFGFESSLLNFIQNGSIDTVNKSANWYNMFDVQFKTGGNEYTGKAENQLKNCAAILKAYPAVKIKLGGYTDNTGAADANKKISQKRADKVKADLIKMGVSAAQVTESIGYGPEFPVCEANDTPECKARNRRVACKVAVK